MDKCSPENLKLLEDFVRAMGKTADAYTTLGGTYLDCDDYPNAKKRFNDAIKLAENHDEPTEAVLVAEYGLVMIDFLEQKIDRDECIALTTEIKERLDTISPFVKRQCNCPGQFGMGTRRKNVCVEPCP